MGKLATGRIVIKVFASLGIVVLLSLLSTMALAAGPSKGGPATSERKSEPRVLIGPVRVKLVGGKILEGIAVFREETRVRLVLEDGTEIAFDPLKVASVTAIADLGREPEKPSALSRSLPPTPEISENDLGVSRGSADRGKDRARRGTPADKGATGKAAASSARTSGAALRGRVEPAAGKTQSAPGASNSAPAASEIAGTADAAAGDAPRGETAAGDDPERKQDMAELAAMLEHAVLNADIEKRPGSEEGDESTEGKPLESPPPSGENTGKEPAYTRPKPEDFDATRPVIHPGMRFLGRKGDLPSTPPALPDFPKPAAPTVSLGASVWHPSNGFSSSAKWPKPLAPATSFSNNLSGLAQPITGLGPSWWNPKPIQWPSSTFPQNWQPTDGFAQSQSSKDASKPQAGTQK